MRGARGTIVALLALVGALAVGDVASADYQRQLTPADQAAARAATLRRSDLGTTTTWKGGQTKPDFSDEDCPGYDPKDSDLVLTGAAASQFSSPGVALQTQSQVLRTAAMVSRDWQRSIRTPALLPCLRRSARKEVGAQGTIVSVGKLSFPRIATYTAAFRVVMDARTPSGPIRLLVDVVAFGKGRTEITLSTIAPYAGRAAVKAAEINLARLLTARIRA